MRCVRFLALVHVAFVCVALGCGWPATRVEPPADYPAKAHPTVSAAPAYTAGPDYRLTYSPDGSTLFVCADGSVEPAWRVTPGGRPAC